ncbi:unannotated protein [freshwater metagenome]|uniref:Unannotated protein n=1 Tax=freshwater metagenome TaxID=449393 RepID=A0A6J7W0X8_9ZZZZ
MYDKVLFNALTAVTVKVPSNSAPTPETMIVLPTTKP